MQIFDGKGAFDVSGFCAWASIGKTSFYEEVKAGRLRITKLKSKTLVRVDDAREWLASLPASTENRSAA